MSHYDTLGLTRHASTEEIVAAVASLRAAVVLDHGTDRFLMTELDEAEFVLGDPDRRAVYDRSLPADPAARRRRLVSAIIWSVPAAFALALVVWTVTGSALAGRLALFGTLTFMPLIALVAARR